MLRSPATQAVLSAFPGHAGRVKPLVRWRSLACTPKHAGAPSLASEVGKHG